MTLPGTAAFDSTSQVRRRGIVERVRMLGGTYAISSVPKHGTTVTIEIPLGAIAETTAPNAEQDGTNHLRVASVPETTM